MIEPDEPGTSPLPTVRRPASRPLGWRWRLLRMGLLMTFLSFSLFVMLQRKLIYVPIREPVEREMVGTLASRLSDVVITTGDDVPLQGWLIDVNPRLKTPGNDRPLVIYFQGNAAHRGRRGRQCGMLSDMGCRVLIVDYRGYAQNPGSPSEPGLREDARSCWRYATETLQVSPDQIFLFGESLGGGVATALASELCSRGVTPGGLIVRASFSSLVDAAAYHYPFLPVRWMLFDRFDSVGQIANVTCPLLIMHGDRDEVIPFRQGERLFAAAREQSASGIHKQFARLAGARHNDIMHVAADQVEDALRQYFATAFPAAKRN